MANQQQRRPAQQQQGRTQQRQQPAPQRTAQRSTALASTTRDAVKALLEDDKIEVIDAGGSEMLASLNKSEVEMQLSAAHKWPRDIKRFIIEATALATFSKETAQSCIYTLPLRKGQEVATTGPSVRLAEMAATAWTNMHIAATIIDTGPREVVARALCWDLEKNVRIGTDVPRGIVTRDGSRFGDDMIRVTQLAAISIALRNVVFRVIPRALINHVYGEAVAVATGKADGTFEAERKDVFDFLVNKWRVEPERILARLEVGSFDEITADHLERLIGLGQAIKDRSATVDECFPPVAKPAATGAPKGKGGFMDATVEQHQQKKRSDPPPANDAVSIERLHQELGDADEAWRPAELIDVIRNWSPAEQRIAWDWASAHNDPTADVPERPEFTVLERQPGED